MSRRTKPRTRVRKEDLPATYNDETIRLISEEADFPKPDIAKLQRRILAAVTAYLDLIEDEQRSIGASRAKKKRINRRRQVGLPVIHTIEERVSIPRPGRRRETSLHVLTSILAAIFSEFSGEIPGRSFDWDSGRNTGRFEAFVYGVVQPLFDPTSMDHFVKEFIRNFQHNQRPASL